MTTETAISFQGSASEQTLAQEVFDLMRMQGALYAEDAPIRQSLANLAAYLAPRHNSDEAALVARLDAVLRQNNTVFAREEREDEVIIVATRSGRLPALGPAVNQHMFRTRLYDPENPLPTDDISVVVSLNRPALTTVEPVFISDYWQQQAGIKPITPLTDEDEAKLAPELAEASPEAAAFEVDGTEPALTPEAEPAPAEVATQATAGLAGEAVAATLVLADGTELNLSEPVEALLAQHGSALGRQLRDAIENDPLRRIVFFGQEAYPEALVSNLGKNDLRRIREYILEVGEPLSDSQIVSDLYHRNARDDEFEGMRFSLNYRLNREKDFSFVGVEGARLWSTNGLPAIGTKRVKAGEMAQILTYLTEGYDDSLAESSAEEITRAGKVVHLLTTFEWQYGILPYNAALQALLPAPVLETQRTSVLRFESPQHYNVAIVELRYPTSNRGGWIQGLEEFFAEHLVPAAQLVIARTEAPNVFTISYEEAPATAERILTLDEKKNKFAFTNTTFYAAVDPDLLPTQQRYGKLRNLKFLPMNERRKEIETLEHVFETVGEQIGTRSEPLYSASLADLFVAINVLRPTSRTLLAHLLEQRELFERENDTTFLYKPLPVEQDEDDEDEDEDEDSYDYDDDE
jgi:hypothetical protein